MGQMHYICMLYCHPKLGLHECYLIVFLIAEVPLGGEAVSESKFQNFQFIKFCYCKIQNFGGIDVLRFKFDKEFGR